VSDLRRLASDPTFLGLWQEGGLIYGAMEMAETAALSPNATMEQVRVIQGRLQGLKLVREYVLKSAAAEGPGEEDQRIEELPRLMRIVSGEV
jgi:hypothetical protein